jgi:hypothetical protein
MTIKEYVTTANDFNTNVSNKMPPCIVSLSGPILNNGSPGTVHIKRNAILTTKKTGRVYQYKSVRSGSRETAYNNKAVIKIRARILISFITVTSKTSRGSTANLSHGLIR